MQVIKNVAPSVASVLNRFDISPCKIGLYVTKCSNGTRAWRLAAAGEWQKSIQRRAFLVPAARWDSSSATRVAKYLQKGFLPLLPKLDAVRVRRTLATLASVQDDEASPMDRLRVARGGQKLIAVADVLAQDNKALTPTNVTRALRQAGHAVALYSAHMREVPVSHVRHIQWHLGQSFPVNIKGVQQEALGYVRLARETIDLT